MESNDGKEVPASNESARKEGAYSCKICDKKFFDYHALGGHSNCHRNAREAEKQNKITSEAEGSASYQPLMISSRVGSGPSNSFSQPHPMGNLGQERSFNSTIPQNAEGGASYKPLMISSRVGSGPSNSFSQPRPMGNLGQERSFNSTIPQNAEGSASYKPLMISSRVGSGPSNSFSQPRPMGNLGQERSFNSTIPQNAATLNLLSSLKWPRGSTGSSLQHHKSYQNRFFPFAATIGAPSSSASQPQPWHPSSSYKTNFGQESSNSSISRGISPSDFNFELLEPLCGERKYDEASSSSVTPHNATTEGLDLNVMASSDENSDQVSSSSTPVNEEEEKLDLNLRL